MSRTGEHVSSRNIKPDWMKHEPVRLVKRMPPVVDPIPPCRPIEGYAKLTGEVVE
ncbi:hypothetical protein [Novipirellula artificiosorum]|uniref:Uncharacterized protein n=1 Tax=Novipirellula artificiosorum TaxID=2528016 RepID=A0A5C6DHG4_9BACT|nr:hypothetical protein [Novipirellula artificiosorum]TWU34486.1 hypothetical protein Poly41_46340 [Novipirellula artificiosorum]